MRTTAFGFAMFERREKLRRNACLLKNNSDRQIDALAPEACAQVAK